MRPGFWRRASTSWWPSGCVTPSWIARFRIFGEDGRCRIGNTEFPIPRTFMGMSVREISRLIGTRISVLLGADILNCFDFRIDLDEGELRVTEEAMTFHGLTISTESFQGVP